MDNSSIASHFNLLADLMELHGENPFKIKSYQQAGRTLGKMDVPLATLNREALEEIPGVGKAIAEKIVTLCNTGQLPILQKYLDITPSGVVEMLNIKGLGPRKVFHLWKDLGISSPGELYYACLENRLTLLKGFGKKTQQTILQHLEYYLQNADKQLYAKAEKKWLNQQAMLQSLLGSDCKMETTGAFRRKEDTLTITDIVLTGITREQLLDKLSASEIEYELKGNKIFPKSELLTGIAIQLANEGHFGTDLFLSSSSEEHIAFVKERLPQQQIPICMDEAAIYQSAGLPLFPPEWRHAHTEWFREPEKLLKGLVKETDIKGVVHAHTDYSDGSNSPEALATFCKHAGYGYLVITDHSQSAFYANGLKENRILEQWAEIDRLNQLMGDFRIFKGIESDILNDGSLDYDNDLLAGFDVVIASVHSQLNMNEEKAMKRLLKAIENPYTHILGHLSGRLLLSRKGYPLNVPVIIDACAANGVSIELNANPHRLDIDWEWIPLAVEKGVLISINPDAHSTSGVGDIRYGIYAARKAALQRDKCLNTLDAESFIKKIKNLKG
jgi:DNA polymerase (family 10)